VLPTRWCSLLDGAAKIARPVGESIEHCQQCVPHQIEESIRCLPDSLSADDLFSLRTRILARATLQRCSHAVEDGTSTKHPKLHLNRRHTQGQLRVASNSLLTYPNVATLTFLLCMPGRWTSSSSSATLQIIPPMLVKPAEEGDSWVGPPHKMSRSDNNIVVLGQGGNGSFQGKL